MFVVKLQACDTQCAIYCNTVECCNVAKCNINDDTCSVGLHNHPIEYAGGESYMVREQHMVGISGKINYFSSLLSYCDISFKEGTF